MTDPAGIVALDAVVTAPTTRPAPLIAAVAAACVVLTTFGTATQRGAGRDNQRNRGASGDLRSGSRVLADDGAGRAQSRSTRS